MSANRSRCDDCGAYWNDDELGEPKRLSERTDPGGKVPSGECPLCYALAYPLDPDEKLVCRTMGANLRMRRAEFEALLAHLKEDPALIRRRLEVLTGEKTLRQVDEEERREREHDIGAALDRLRGEGFFGSAARIESGEPAHRVIADVALRNNEEERARFLRLIRGAEDESR